MANEGGAERLSGVRGDGMECRRSGMIGRQLDEVERRSLSVVRHDFWTLIMDEVSSSCS